MFALILTAFDPTHREKYVTEFVRLIVLKVFRILGLLVLVDVVRLDVVLRHAKPIHLVTGESDERL